MTETAPSLEPHEERSAATAESFVEATERIYRALFVGALAYAVATVAWGVILAPFNGYREGHLRSLAIGVVLLVLAILALLRRQDLYYRLRADARWLVLPAALGVAALWADGGWRSTFYLASYAAVVLAAVVGGVRWALGCAATAAAGYVAGLVLNGYSWSELVALKDADSVVANTGGYFIAAVFFSLPVAWLGGYVGRINQVLEGRLVKTPAAPDSPPGKRTASLSAREVQVVQLIAGGATNEEVAGVLFLSKRTVQSHVDRIMRKTDTRNRTQLAVLAVQEGLVPEHVRGAAEDR